MSVNSFDQCRYFTTDTIHKQICEACSRFEKNELRLYKVIVSKGLKEVAHLRIVADSINAAGKIARNVFKDACVGFSVLDLGLPVSRKEKPRVLVNENLN